MPEKGIGGCGVVGLFWLGKLTAVAKEWWRMSLRKGRETFARSSIAQNARFTFGEPSFCRSFSTFFLATTLRLGKATFS